MLCGQSICYASMWMWGQNHRSPTKPRWDDVCLQAQGFHGKMGDENKITPGQKSVSPMNEAVNKRPYLNKMEGKEVLETLFWFVFTQTIPYTHTHTVTTLPDLPFSTSITDHASASSVRGTRACPCLHTCVLISYLPLWPWDLHYKVSL